MVVAKKLPRIRVANEPVASLAANRISDTATTSTTYRWNSLDRSSGPALPRIRRYNSVKLDPAKNIATIAIHSIAAESKCPSDELYVEKPPVDTVVKLWATPS